MGDDDKIVMRVLHGTPPNCVEEGLTAGDLAIIVEEMKPSVDPLTPPKKWRTISEIRPQKESK